MAFAQNTPKKVSLVVSADGATKTEAINNALRSAIEQTYGAFVSTNTEILNDQIVKDEISTVSSGNIEKYKEISYIEIDRNRHWITLEVIVSLKRLTKYAKGKGSKCELDGATFSANRRLYEFNRAATIKAYDNLYTTIQLAGSSLFDYKITTSEPYVKNGNTYVKITVNVHGNNNTKKMRNYIISTLYSLSTSEKVGYQNKKSGFDMHIYRIATAGDIHGYKYRWFYAPIDYEEINSAINDAVMSYIIEDNLLHHYYVETDSLNFVSLVEYDERPDFYTNFYSYFWNDKQYFKDAIIIFKLDRSTSHSFSSECQVPNIEKITDIELKQINTQTLTLPNKNEMHKMHRWQFFALYNYQSLGSYKYLSSTSIYSDDYSKVLQSSNGLFLGADKRFGLYGKINFGRESGRTESSLTYADTLSRLDGNQLVVGLMFRCSSMIHGYCGIGINNYQLKSRYKYYDANMYEWHISDHPIIYKDLSGYLVDAGVLLHFYFFYMQCYMTLSIGRTYYLSTKNAYYNFGVGICL